MTITIRHTDKDLVEKIRAEAESLRDYIQRNTRAERDSYNRKLAAYEAYKAYCALPFYKQVFSDPVPAAIEPMMAPMAYLFEPRSKLSVLDRILSTLDSGQDAEIEIDSVKLLT